LVEMVTELKNVQVVGQTIDAREAIADIRRLEPDLAILDIRLANGNGIEILEIVKMLRVPPLVIMMTAFPNQQYRRKCMSAGADYFFDKTNEFERVVEEVKKCVELSAAAV